MNGFIHHTALRRRIWLAAAVVVALAAPAMAQQAVSDLDREIYYIRVLSEQLVMLGYAEFVLGRLKTRHPEAGPRLKAKTGSKTCQTSQ